MAAIPPKERKFAESQKKANERESLKSPKKEIIDVRPVLGRAFQKLGALRGGKRGGGLRAYLALIIQVELRPDQQNHQ